MKHAGSGILVAVLQILVVFCLTHCHGAARIRDGDDAAAKLFTEPDKAGSWSSWLPGLLARWEKDKASTPPGTAKPATAALEAEDADEVEDLNWWKDKLWATQLPVAETQQPNDGIVVGVNGEIVSSWNGDLESWRPNQRPWLSREVAVSGGSHEENVADGNTKTKANGGTSPMFPNGAATVEHESDGRAAGQRVTLDPVTQPEGKAHQRITRDVTEQTHRQAMSTHDMMTRSESQNPSQHDATKDGTSDEVGAFDAANHPAKMTAVTQTGYDSTPVTQEHHNIYDRKVVTPDIARTHIFRMGGHNALDITTSTTERLGMTQGESVVTHPQDPDDPLAETEFSEVENKDKMNLEALVLTLQSQLHESRTSQVRTRSVLNTLEERQAAMERDIQALKEDLRHVKAAQRQDHQSIEAMNVLIENNAWGVANIKTNQNQLMVDFHGLKGWLETHNDTLVQLEELSLGHDLMQLNQGSFLQQLNSDIQELAEAAKEDRHTINRLKHHMHQKLTQVAATQAQAQARPNKVIINVPESANGTELAEYLNWEKRAAALEEMSNVVEHQLQELNQKEADMEGKVSTMNERFGQYDAELSRIYTMFYNLSLQMSSLENKLLSKKQVAVESEMSNLQKSFLNFTQQLMSMEQHNAVSRHTLNNTSTVQGHLTQVLDHHDNRISTVETQLQDHQSHTKLRHNKVSYSLTKINDTVVAMQQWMEEHRSKASNVFQNVDQELEAFREQTQSISDRLLQVEVKVLNVSLQKCQKTNSDLHQDMKMSDFSNELFKMGGRVGDHSSQINRLDRGVSQLFRELETVTETTTSMLDDITDLLHLIPEVAAVQREVNNLIAQLPTDCKDIALSSNARHSKLYLLKPGKVLHSALTYCEFDEVNDADWTYIQRRDDGSITFDRTWEEYREGFGSPDSEFWIGNDNLHFLTNHAQYMLQIDMWDLQNQYIYAQYDNFRVEDASTNFRLHIDGYQGNATDSLKYANYMPFSTPDMDNDFSSTHCAKFYTAGWWYKHCSYGNLNGRYTVGMVWFNQDLDEWVQLKKTVMKLQRVNDTALYSDVYAGV